MNRSRGTRLATRQRPLPVTCVDLLGAIQVATLHAYSPLHRKQCHLQAKSLDRYAVASPRSTLIHASCGTKNGPTGAGRPGFALVLESHTRPPPRGSRTERLRPRLVSHKPMRSARGRLGASRGTPLVGASNPLQRRTRYGIPENTGPKPGRRAAGQIGPLLIRASALSVAGLTARHAIAFGCGEITVMLICRTWRPLPR